MVVPGTRMAWGAVITVLLHHALARNPNLVTQLIIPNSTRGRLSLRKPVPEQALAMFLGT